MDELPRYLQLLWEREPVGRRGPKPARSIEEIGRAAVAIADEQGLEAVSMKSVAQAIGFTTMSLYRYVDSKDQLEAVMLDLAYGPADLDYGHHGWRARLTMWAKAIAARRLAHPWSVELAPPGMPLTPHALAWMEAGLEALAETPLTDQQRLSAMLAVDGWGQNHVRQSTRMGLVGRIDPTAPRAADIPLLTALIDPVRFPHLVRAAPAELDDDDALFFDEEFDRGIALILDGIAAMIARSRP